MSLISRQISIDQGRNKKIPELNIALSADAKDEKPVEVIKSYYGTVTTLFILAGVGYIIYVIYEKLNKTS